MHPWCTHTFPGEQAGIASRSPEIPAAVWNCPWTLTKKESALGCWRENFHRIPGSLAGHPMQPANGMRQQTHGMYQWLGQPWEASVTSCLRHLTAFLPGTCLARAPGLQHFLCCHIPTGKHIPFSHIHSLWAGLGLEFCSRQPAATPVGGRRTQTSHYCTEGEH